MNLVPTYVSAACVAAIPCRSGGALSHAMALPVDREAPARELLLVRLLLGRELRRRRRPAPRRGGQSSVPGPRGPGDSIGKIFSAFLERCA